MEELEDTDLEQLPRRDGPDWPTVARTTLSILSVVLVGLLTWGGITLTTLQSKVDVLSSQFQQIQENQKERFSQIEKDQEKSDDSRAEELIQIREDNREMRALIQEIRLLVAENHGKMRLAP